LHQRLTHAETGQGQNNLLLEKIGSTEASMKRGEREKNLEKQVLTLFHLLFCRPKFRLRAVVEG
jgi:hypothetical protein